MSIEESASKDIRPTVNSETAIKLGLAFDQGFQHFAKEKAGRTYFMVAETLAFVSRSQSLGYIREQIPHLLGDTKKEKYIKGAAFLGGAAVGLLIAKKVIGNKWDDKLTEGFQKTSQLITKEGRTLQSVCEEGFENQDDTARMPMEAMADTAYPGSAQASYFLGGLGFVRATLRHIPRHPKRNKRPIPSPDQHPIKPLDAKSVEYASYILEMLRQSEEQK